MSININLNNKYYYFQLLLSLIYGIFGVLAFSPYNFWPASIISLTGLLIMMLNATRKKAIWYTFLWGIGFFSSGLYWIYIGIAQFINIHNYINIIIIILLIIYLTCFPILFAILFIMLRSLINKWHLIFVTPILWSGTEYLRGNLFTGFPWLQFGYSQIDGPIKGLAPILGVDSITFVLVLISGLLALSVNTIHILPTIISLIILFSIWPLTWVKWYHLSPQRSISVSLIQGNIGHQHITQNIHNIESTLNIYLTHTLPLLGKTKIIIWPESAISGIKIDNNTFFIILNQQLKKCKTYLITGIIDTQYSKNNYHYYNSMIVLPNSIPHTYLSNNRYDKHHLVLFAEKFPFEKFFKPFLQYFNIPISFIKPGNYLQTQLKIEDIKITATICYEIILGHQIRDNFQPDTDLLLTVANDIWFGHSIGPWQHFQMARMRALELGRPLLCSTNNGVTAIIYADGSIQLKLPQFISTVLTANVVPTFGITPYSKIGGYWMIGVIIVFIIYIYIIIHNIFFKKNSI